MYPHAEGALKDGVEYIYGSAVEGDVAEFGCFRGRTAAVLAQHMKYCDEKYGTSDKDHGIKERMLRLFDSFKGLPATTHPADVESPHLTSRVWHEGAIANTTMELVMDVCAEHLPRQRILIEPGFFNSTLAYIPKEVRFAMVHLDCDYYESTLQVLEHLLNYEMLSDGCTLFFDDWYCNRGSPRFGQQAAWRDIWQKHGPAPGGVKLNPAYSFTDWGPYGVVQRRFIIHKVP